MTITIGLDIAKSVFEVHGIDAEGKAIIRRLLKRRNVLLFFEKLQQPCLVGIEACASAHYWSRELQALGHTVRMGGPRPRRTYQTVFPWRVTCRCKRGGRGRGMSSITVARNREWRSSIKRTWGPFDFKRWQLGAPEGCAGREL